MKTNKIKQLKPLSGEALIALHKVLKETALSKPTLPNRK